jgi:aminocarboxymuconate-semialdehyde decarboxylase
MNRPTMHRREFVRTAARLIAGVAAGGGLTAGTTALAQNARREVRIGGRRIKTVDVHAHCVVPGVMEILGQTTPANNAQLVLGPDRIRVMDKLGIDVEVLSINPFWYGLDRDAASRVIALQNEKLAALCAAHPDRLVALATVALQHPELAAEQLETGLKEYGLRGVSVGGRVVNEELASRRLDPFWARVEALGAPIFLHPIGMTDFGRLAGNGYLTNVIGNPLDTTIALSHLIFEGVLDRFPSLKIVAAHGGGFLGSYLDRSDNGCLRFPEQCTAELHERPTDYLKRMSFDSLVFTGEALGYLVERYGADHIMLGSDYPYPWVPEPVDHVLATPGLSDAERIAILGGNAMALFNIPA